MATDVLMPKLSDTMEEGKILKWLKQPGDRVKSGDLLAEVETDKANMEIESFDEGVVTELRVAEGESAPVGAVIAVLGAEGEAKAKSEGQAKPKTEGDGKPASAPASKPTPPTEPKAPAQPAAEKKPAAKVEASKDAEPAAEGEGTGERPQAEPASHVKASPLARKIAAERGVDLTRVKGTGPGGRIVEKDVEGAAPKPPEAERDTSPKAAPAAGRRELSRMRKTTAKRMADAKRDVPHFYASAELAMDE